MFRTRERRFDAALGRVDVEQTSPGWTAHRCSKSNSADDTAAGGKRSNFELVISTQMNKGALMR